MARHPRTHGGSVRTRSMLSAAAAVVIAAGGNPLPTPTPTPTPTLGSLALSASLIIGQAVTAIITGWTAGSTIASNIPGMAQPIYGNGIWSISGTPTGSSATITNGLVETLGNATNSPKSTPITTTAVAFAAYQQPVADWRMVASAVTVDGVANAALLAQQAAIDTKTRGASVAVGSTPRVIVYEHAAGREKRITWAGLGVDALPSKVEGWDGSAWIDMSCVELKPGATVDDRRQVWHTLGTHTKTRLTLQTSGTTYDVYPLMHEVPATGKIPVTAMVDNSQVQKVLAPRSQELAILAANPTWDGYLLSWAQTSASAETIVGSLDQMVTRLRKYSDYCLYGQMLAGANTSGYSTDPSISERPALTSQSKYVDTATMHSLLDPIIDQGAAKLANSGWIVFGTAGTYRTYTNAGPSALPGYDAADAQEKGMLPFNRESINPKLASFFPAQYDTTYARPKLDVYLAYLYRRSAIGDGIHPTGTTGPFTLSSVQSWWAQTVFRAMFFNVYPTPEIEQRATSAEGSLLQADFDELVFALNVLTASSGKTAIVNRRTALYPFVLLKTANLAIAAYEASKAAADKTAAQSARQAAIDAGASAANVTTAYGNTVNLSGTDQLLTRINAVSSITIVQRMKVNMKTNGSPAGFTTIPDSTLGVTTALLRDDGSTDSGWKATLVAAFTDSAANGVAAATGTAPNDIPATVNKSYISSTGSNPVQVLLGRSTSASGRKARFTWSSGRATVGTNRHAALTVLGGASQTGETLNGDGVAVQSGLLADNVAATGASATISTDGTATITVTAVASGLLAPGQAISGAGIPTGTTIASTTASGGGRGGTGKYVLSQPTTATATGVAATATGDAFLLSVTPVSPNASGAYWNGLSMEEYTA